ncbi:hypothetical protein G1C98_0879 [Bifidobacterium sp. DSM 109960]|uniref:DUF881 domain-containing protein n=1 Tax=Bifidobacterium erythrocebi TaxID=2675325 RepID=A0A7Y0ETJ1_9BIFI|nr:DUF881 domain-containing protein [Bifidobacterium sp. DSM 109960]NMM96143.1 hypothetical protein [Bifidobacterium sp. DSM 109960]
MSGMEPMPASYPVEESRDAKHRRAVFSHSFAGLISQHAAPEDIFIRERERRHRVRKDDSLRLIDDLINRPVDPMFLDSNLGKHNTSPFAVWATRIICFVVCIAVGFLGCLFVQQLHSDPRRAVRASLAKELRESQSTLDKLSSDVASLHKQVDEQSKKVVQDGSNSTLMKDEMASGQLAVRGEGIILTVADPIAAANESNGATPRENSGNRLRVVTDGDLQQLVSVLWRAGAEAISINDERLGAQTSIRTAGNTILIGLNAVESPYRIRAIGNRHELAQSVGQRNLGSMYTVFEQAGISLHVQQSKELTLKSAVISDVNYARKAE